MPVDVKLKIGIQMLLKPKPSSKICSKERKKVPKSVFFFLVQQNLFLIRGIKVQFSSRQQDNQYYGSKTHLINKLSHYSLCQMPIQVFYGHNKKKKRQKFDKVEVFTSPVVQRQYQPIGMTESKNQTLLDQLGGQQVKANEKSVKN